MENHQKIIETYYPRSIIFAKAIDLNLLENLTSEKKSTPKAIINTFYDKIRERIKEKKDFLRMLQEILDIEREKAVLKDDSTILSSIQEYESKHDFKREKLLSANIELANIKFQLSPFVTTYESYWNWVVRETEVENFDIRDNLNNQPEDYYFLFQRTGTYDDILDNNVFEFPLSKYQYFLLEIFESQKTISNASEEFSQVFEYATKNERKEFEDLTLSLIRDLIFRKFIVSI